MSCGKAKGEAMAEREKEEKDWVGNRHDRGTIRSVFRFGWDAIRAWIVRPNPDCGASQANAELDAERWRIGPNENRGDKSSTTKSE